MTKRISPDVDSRLLNKADVEEVFRLWSLELTDRQIATRMNIHHKTVAAHRKKRGVGPNGRARRFLNIVDGARARCSRCGLVKPLHGWPRQTRASGESYRYSYCADCKRDQQNKNNNRSHDVNLQNRWNRLRNRANKLGIVCDITLAEFVERWRAQHGRCFYTDVELTLDSGKGVSPNSCSVDKVEPSLGYVSGNVVFASKRANTIKHDLSVAELAGLIPEWARRISAWRSAGIPCAQVAEGDF